MGTLIQSKFLSPLVWFLPSLLLLSIGWAIRQVPEVHLDPQLALSVQVLSQENQQLRIFTTPKGYWRIQAQLEKIQPEFLQALIQYEDKRFYQHQGVDSLALARAIFQRLSSGKIISGASTLSMQTLRLIQPKPRTLANKALEIIQALKLETQYSKQEILQTYLTLAPYGGNIQGIEAASFFYFGHSPQRLTPSEIALLISLPQSPESRRPDRNLQNAIKARKHVLERLLKEGQITQETLELANQQPIPDKRIKTPFLAPHLAQRLKSQRQLPIIKTTIDFQLQQKLQNLAKQSQEKLPQDTTLAIIIMDNKSHQIKAHIGSGDFFQAGQLDLSRTIRSPGSTLKPFIYGLGFEKNLFHPNTWVDDSPYRQNNYRPENFDNKYLGIISITKALTSSRNIPAVLALEKIGVYPFLQRFTQLGIKLHLPNQQAPGLAIALGGIGSNLTDLTSLYAALANQGQWQPAHNISKAKQPNQTLLSNQAAKYLDHILLRTPAPLGFVRHRPIRYKTGTSYGSRDTWSVGYDDQFTVGVWVGQIDGSFSTHQTGFNTAAPLLFESFNLLPQHPMKSPTPIQLTQHKELPKHLQWLGKKTIAGSSQPKILFPIDKSRLKLAPSQRNIILSAQGGTPPFHWLINQQLVPTLGYQQHTSWTPDGLGQQHIRVIDAKGKMDQIQVWIE